MLSNKVQLNLKTREEAVSNSEKTCQQQNAPLQSDYGKANLK